MLFDTGFKPLIKRHGLFVLGLSFFFFIFFKNAWVADDAYIAFRSVEQLFAGNGPRWNFDERVQVFTSPLWFVLLAISRLIMDNLFIGSIAVSALCCAFALWIAHKLIGDHLRWLLFVGLVSGMWALMDFTTSGLENPLLYALLSAYLYFYFSLLKESDSLKKQKWLTGLFFSLGLLSITRHDVAVLVILPSLYIVWKGWREFGLKPLLIKSYLIWLPLLAWTLFSIIYYGAPFPNTAYAKMMHGIARHELIDFGTLYIHVSLRWDTVAQITLLLVFVQLAWKREMALFWLLGGVLLNVVYIVYVGGDFMQGRFLSAPLFFAALAFCASLQVSRKVLFALTMFIFLLMLVSNSPLKLPADSGFDIHEGKRHYSWRGILNERNFYFKSNSLWAYYQYKKTQRDTLQPFPNHKWCLMGKRATEQNKQVSDFGGIGMYGYCAGLELIVIDNLALGEPFLARLPKLPQREWRAGHFHRDYPRGFYDSRISGENHLVDPDLSALWEDIVQLTRAPLWTRQRWQAIWRINTGHYRDIGPAYVADIAAKRP
jgi:arabinofuranosyltransferase